MFKIKRNTNIMELKVLSDGLTAYLSEELGKEVYAQFIVEDTSIILDIGVFFDIRGPRTGIVRFEHEFYDDNLSNEYIDMYEIETFPEKDDVSLKDIDDWSFFLDNVRPKICQFMNKKRLYKIIDKDNERYVTEEEAEKLVKEYREKLGIFSVDETWRTHEEICLIGYFGILPEPPREEFLKFTKELNIPITIH